MAQSTARILMIRPSNFGFNEETANNNEFQNRLEESVDTSKLAIEEFNKMVELLRYNGLIISVVQDTNDPVKPDAIFPNNWLSTHPDGIIATWPMYAPNRRVERQNYITDHLSDLYKVNNRISFENYENENIFLEGTGSLVLDRINKIAYACLSDRTNQCIIEDFCNKLDYTSVVFHALGNNNQEIYHTNVMMAIGTDIVVICMDSILEESQDIVRSSITNSGKEVIEISKAQMNAFSGNMLEAVNTDGERLMLMSRSAFNSLEPNQIASIEKSCRIISLDIPTIQTVGGGSVRCMLCEIYLDPKA